MKEYSTFSESLALLESHYQIASCHKEDTRLWGGLTPMLRHIQGSLQPQPTGLTFPAFFLFPEKNTAYEQVLPVQWRISPSKVNMLLVHRSYRVER